MVIGKEMVEVIETTQIMQAAKVEEQLLFEEQFEALTNEYNEVKENLTRENDLLGLFRSFGEYLRN